MSKRIFSILMMVVWMFTVSCNSLFLKQIRFEDASVIPKSTFIYIELDVYIKQSICTDTCELKTETTYASGFVVLKSHGIAYAMTAQHFCKEISAAPNEGYEKLDQTFSVYDYVGRKYNAKFVFSNDAYDVCVISFDAPHDDVAASTLGYELPEIGSRVYTISAPKGYFLPNAALIFEGIYSGINDETMVSTIPTESGSSGSPIFNGRGEVVGMTLGVPAVQIKNSDGTLREERINHSICLAAPIGRLRVVWGSLIELHELLRATSHVDAR